ncbi:MAG TPA: NIPSNAP family protein [Planctomycetaceae bacterium]|nr:NIPSNAP family protein [Planctomycetaceae bacterium]
MSGQSATVVVNQATTVDEIPKGKHSGSTMMPRRVPRDLFHLLIVMVCLGGFAGRAEEPAASRVKVYGEWRIAVKADKGSEYDRLIETEGLPLFRKAGGRMVGWWKTLIGNLYEHVTIWEYDDMAAFEKAIGILGGEKRFAEFVAKRDPLLSGEENRFLKLAAGAASPSLPDPSKFVIHETHRVPLKRQGEYLDWMKREGLKMLEKHGFRPVGPWTTAVGRWSEATLLFRFDSLAERDKLIARFGATDDGKKYGERLGELVDEVTTRMLIPADFAKPAAGQKQVQNAPVSSSLLPHLERVSPRVFAAGFADKFRSANCGFFAAGDSAVLIDLPRGVGAAEFSKEVARLTGFPMRRLVLTHADKDDLAIVSDLVAGGVREVIASSAARDGLLRDRAPAPVLPIRVYDVPTDIDHGTLRFIPVDGVASASGAAVEIPSEGVLFAGPLVVNGPRARLAGCETAEWVAQLSALESRGYDRVIPGFGSWTLRDSIARQRRFLEELRSQVAYAVALGKPPEALEKHVRISPGFQVWMPYDNPVAEDLLFVYRELTAPNAPFNGRDPRPDDARPHALVVIGDGPHEPQHLEKGLAPAFAAAGVIPHFTVDVKALSAESLARVKLLVVLRDGLMRPTDDPKSHYCWVTREHERAVVEFVERGGGFLNLHNALGLYPDDGPYLKLAAGRYIGHGPLERFRVEAIDAEHPITRGISPFTVADEQHTPVVDRPRVRMLLRSRSDDGILGDAGWVYEPGSGRLCHLACGHTREALLHPTYQELMRNAMLWCLKLDAPAR